MQGHDRYLDREPGQEGQEYDHLQPAPLGRHRQGVEHRGVGEPLDVEGHDAGLGGVPEHDHKQPQKCQQASGKRVHEELDRRLPPLLVSPDADQKEERHECELEEDVEQEQVAGGEHAKHRRLEHEQKHIEAHRPVGDRFPAHEHGRDREQGRKAEHPEGEAVEAEGQPNVEEPAGEPGHLNPGEGNPGGRRGIGEEAGDQPAGQAEGGQSGDGGALPHRCQAAGAERPGHHRTDQRRDDDQEQVGLGAEAVHGE